MINVFYPCDKTISAPGELWDSSDVSGACSVQLETGSCQDIQFAFTDYHSAIGFYPVSCDFATLSYSGMVFFQDPNTLNYGNSIEVYALDVPKFTKTDIDTLFSIETGFLVCVIGFWTIARQLRKISPLLF